MSRILFGQKRETPTAVRHYCSVILSVCAGTVYTTLSKPQNSVVEIELWYESQDAFTEYHTIHIKQITFLKYNNYSDIVGKKILGALIDFNCVQQFVSQSLLMWHDRKIYHANLRTYTMCKLLALWL